VIGVLRAELYDSLPDKSLGAQRDMAGQEFAKDQTQGVLEDPDLLREVFFDMRLDVCLMYVSREHEMRHRASLWKRFHDNSSREQ
jgi:hypothetical protein